jgi:hypothetical protein
MDSPEPADSLSPKLQAWRVAPQRNPQFRAEVWQRIATRGRSNALPWTGYVRSHAGTVAGAVAIASLLGALAGRDQARTRVAAESTRMASAYVQALDPRNMTMP